MSETGKKKSVVDRVVDGIVSGIISGEFQPGSKLPTEVELCRQYEAGRNSVREAIKKLEANGVVYIKRADGTFVSETYNQKLLDPMLYQIILKKNSWKDFVQLRAVIEIGTLNVILENDPDEEKIRNLYEIQEKMEAALNEKEPDPNRIMRTDTEFHAGIAALSDNPQIHYRIYNKTDSSFSPGGHLQGHKKRRGFPLCRASQGDSGSNLKKGKGQDCPDCN